MKKYKTKNLIILYYLIFFLTWTIFEFSIKPHIGLYFDGWVATIIKSGIIKMIVWVLPSIFLINIYEPSLFVNMKDMFINKVKWFNYLPIFILFTLYIIIVSYIRNGEVSINNDFGLNVLLIALFAGITEEVVFRGWLLNAMLEKKKIKLIILINAVLFLGIHFPRFIYDGILIQNLLNGRFLSLIILSSIFSISFIKSKNIMVPIILHIYWDLLMFLLL